MKKQNFFLLFLMILPLSTLSAEETQWAVLEQKEAYHPNKYSLLIRPQASWGWAGQYAGDDKGFTSTRGARIMLSAGSYQRWGLDLSCRRTDFDEEETFLRAGIILEQLVWKYFHMAIGTVGYIGLDDTEGNPFGISSGLGYERQFGRFSLALVYESEVIFNSHITSINGVQLIVGMGL